MTSPEQQRPNGDAVEVRIPADVVYVSTLRLTAASLAARCDLTIDDIEDLRLAVDEACALLLPHASQTSTLDARFELHTGRLTVDTRVATDITALNAEIARIVARQQELREQIDAIVADLEGAN